MAKGNAGAESGIGQSAVLAVNVAVRVLRSLICLSFPGKIIVHTKVLHITGLGRSGSTLVGNVLNEVEGFFNVGELCAVWHYGLGYNYNCGCGQPFRECSIWQNIFKQAFGSMRAMKGYKSHRPTSRQLMLKMFGIKSKSEIVNRDYLEVLERLYKAVQDVTGCRVIVDTSKYPAHAFLLQQIATIDSRILHLVRDPRGISYSWQKHIIRKDVGPPGHKMKRFKVSDTSLKWLLWNAQAESLGRKGQYIRVRYEEFVQEPGSVIKEVASLCGEKLITMPAVDGEIDMGENHMVMGNPNRSNRGTVQLHRDDKWRREMSLQDQALVTLLCWPLMMRYGYITMKGSSK